jgi:hypothetical protein
MRNRLPLALITLMAALTLAGAASAQAGLACSGTVCGLGGQIRHQDGRNGHPLPYSSASARTGPFVDITIQSLPASLFALPLVGQGLGQPGQIKPTPSATIMQTLGSAPRALTLGTGQFFRGGQPQQSILFIGAAVAIFGLQTNLSFTFPHPGTTGNTTMNTVPGQGGSMMFSAGGRPGGATITFCSGSGGAGGSPDNNFNGACQLPGNGAAINGLVRFTRTSNQFGGIGSIRKLGTAKNYINKDGLALTALPCTGCEFYISEIVPVTLDVGGGEFGGTAMNPAFQTPTGVYTGTVGFNGSIIGVGNAITISGVGIPFTGATTSSVGFPWTTGRITISITDVLPGMPPEIFIRTGIDARDANGNGVIALNTGSMSVRSISNGHANRIWMTVEIPEPSAIAAASAGLLSLFGCHHWVRRR